MAEDVPLKVNTPPPGDSAGEGGKEVNTPAPRGSAGKLAALGKLGTALGKIWPSLIILLAIVVLLIFFHGDLGAQSNGRFFLVAIVTCGLIAAAVSAFFPNSGGPTQVKYVIAFNSCCFVYLGLAATVLICAGWATASLLGGACLLVGGFLGLLFGYPQGVAQQNTPVAQGQNPAPQGQNPPVTTNRDKNLVAESAATLGKVIAGFTLAKFDQIITRYWSLCQLIGPALGIAGNSGNVVAGIIMSYFLATGFLSGLLLPSYFMSDFLNQ
jgi:hypothetical protein